MIPRPLAISCTFAEMVAVEPIMGRRCAGSLFGSETRARYVHANLHNIEPERMNKHQTAVAAEAFTAGAFAQAGYSVFVQYGANQPGYDLIVSNADTTMHVSVKGSTNGEWILTKKDVNGTYGQALDDWILRNGRFVFCLVQFTRVKAGEIPRIYLATGEKIGEELKTHWFGEVCLSLYEQRVPTIGKNKGKTMKLPTAWRLTEDRIRELMGTNTNGQNVAIESSWSSPHNKRLKS